MDEPKSDPPRPREYHVLVEGQMHGPFTAESLKAALEAGDVTPEDLVQVGGLPIWRPLRQVLDSPRPLSPDVELAEGNLTHERTPTVGDKNTERTAGVPVAHSVAAGETESVESVSVEESELSRVASDWKGIGQLAWSRLRNDFEERPVGTGLICLGVGVVASLAAFWPFLFWLPWFGLAFFAGFDALKRGKTMQGVGLLVAACAIPIVFSTIVSFFRPRPVESFGLHSDFSGIGESSSTVNRTPSRASSPYPGTDSTARPERPAAPLLIESVRPVPLEQTSSPVLVPPPRVPSAATPAPRGATPSPRGRTPTSQLQENTVPADRVSALANVLPPSNDVEIINTQASEPVKPSGLPEVAPSGGSAGELVQMHRNAFVVVKDGSASGSGFICRDGNKTYLYTNAHVAAGMRNPQFSRLDGTQIRVSSVEAGGPRDVVRFGITDAALSLDILPNLDASVRIGDEVVVLGNSGGGGVVTALNGKLVGIGPDRIEVSAEFIPGNSGSPIIHVPTGKVIGIATYLTKRRDEFASANNATVTKDGATVRRFGYRLDGIERWEPVNWTTFHTEAEQMRQISALTADIFNFIESIESRKEPEFQTATLRRPATEWLTGIRRPKVSDADRNRTTQTFLSSLRFMVRSDVTAAESRLRYSYFREQLRKEKEVRDQLFKSFDDEVKKLVSPSMR